MRQPDPAVRGYAVTHPPGVVALPTQPGWQQIIYARSGLLTARTDDTTWTVPPHRALCIGGDDRVRLQTSRPTAIRCLYFHRELGALPCSTRVVGVPPLARELLLDAIRRCPLDLSDPVDAALLTVTLDRLAALQDAPLHLPRPTGADARLLADAVVDDPRRSLDELISSIPVSRRSLERRFREETQMTLAGWQRRARVLASIGLMADGQPVSRAATAVGYATPSSFVAAFRLELGMPPGAFMRRDPLLAAVRSETPDVALGIGDAEPT